MMKKKSFKIAFCGIMAALSTVLLSLTGMIPALTYAAPLYVSILLIPVLVETGKGGAWCVWAATCILTFLLSPDKEAVAFYVFLGYYPIIKSGFDKISAKPLRVILKLAFFSASIAVMYLLLIYLFRLDSVIKDFDAAVWINVGSCAFLAGIMMVFDFLVARLTALYISKIRPKLKIR